MSRSSPAPYIAALHVYPVKSCAGAAVGVRQGEGWPVGAAGLADDREWMVVDDATGDFVTQRDAPRLALVRPRFCATHWTLEAPGLGPLALDRAPPGSEAPRIPVRVWSHAGRAFDMGHDAAAWFSEHLRRPVRLVRFDARETRLSDPAWTAGRVAPNRFSDGFPVLVISTKSLEALNARLSTPLPMNRFRPNVVLGGLDAFDEDHLRSIRIAVPGGTPLVLALVKPCTRCPITTTDQDTAIVGAEPLATLAIFRSDPRMGGAATFGQNAIVESGAGAAPAVGDPIELDWNF